MTSFLLYTLAQIGFKVDILQFGMNVVMDVIHLSVGLHDGNSDEECIDLSEPLDMEG